MWPAAPARAAVAVGAPAQAMLGVGEVRHTRLRPARNQFNYPTYFLMLPMRSLRIAPCRALRRNRFALIGFHDRDHGDGRGDSLAWIDELLLHEGVRDALGEVWLHCYPRVLGHTFKPVSFWYCHRTDGSLAAVVVEVNNTFGERHCYLLSGNELAFGRELRATKVFHVSPFCAVAGSYRFRFMRTGANPAAPPEPHPPMQPVRNVVDRTVARIDHHDEQGLLIRTSVSGTLRPLTATRLRAAFFGMPMMTLGVVDRIHWQAVLCQAGAAGDFRDPALNCPEPP